MQTIKTSNMAQITAAWAGQQSIDSALDAAAAKATTELQQYKQQLGN